MYSESDLEGAVAAGVIPQATADAFRQHIAATRVTPAVDEESFRLLTGFNDIFVCNAIAFYFAQKKHGSSAKERLELLSRHIQTAEVTRGCVLSALADPKVHDLGDGLEYYAALDAGCHCIVTENKKDFFRNRWKRFVRRTDISGLRELDYFSMEGQSPHIFSKIEVLDSLEFYRKYMVKQRG